MKLTIKVSEVDDRKYEEWTYEYIDYRVDERLIQMSTSRQDPVKRRVE